MFSRGDRRLGRAIEEAWRRGCRFDGWTEHLRYEEWLAIFDELGIPAHKYLEERRTDIVQCWEHIRSPVSRKFLLRERLKAYAAEVSVDCRLAFCHACGIDDCPDRISPTGRPEGARTDFALPEAPDRANGSSQRELLETDRSALALATRFRLRFEKMHAVRFLSHLELMRIWERALRRSGLPVAYSQGFRKHMKMSFGPPLPLGYVSRAEYFDLEFVRPPGADLCETLNPLLPEGVRLLSWQPVLYKTNSLMNSVDTAAYRAVLTDAILEESGIEPDALEDRISEAIAQLLQNEPIPVRRKGKGGNWKEIDIRPSIESLTSSVTNRTLECTIRMIPGSQARPEDILQRILPAAEPRLALVERMGLWRANGNKRLDPFEVLRAMASPHRNGGNGQGKPNAETDRDQRGSTRDADRNT